MSLIEAQYSNSSLPQKSSGTQFAGRTKYLWHRAIYYARFWTGSFERWVTRYGQLKKIHALWAWSRSKMSLVDAQNSHSSLPQLSSAMQFAGCTKYLWCRAIHFGQFWTGRYEGWVTRYGQLKQFHAFWAWIRSKISLIEAQNSNSLPQ